MPEFNTDVDIDPSDYWSECSIRDKKELAEYAIEDGYAQKQPIKVGELFNGSTYTETELGKLLLEIWENRNWFSIKDIDAIRNQLKEDRKL
jgi:hypothetical protein